MDIRTKLALALVGVALLSMLALGGFTYQVSADLLQEISERQLDALAEAKEQDIEGLVEGWRNDVRLIRSRTQLRNRLREYQDNLNPEALVDIEQILSDALNSSENVARIILFDRAGEVFATVGSVPSATQLSPNLDNEEIRYAGFLLNGATHLVFHTRVRLDGETIGGMEVIITANELHMLSGNYRGLGETGETLVVAQREPGNYFLLHEARHSELGPAWADPPQYITDSLNGVEQVITDNVLDYRDEEVWVATRAMEDPPWGLVIKIDADEEAARPLRLREQMIDVALALGAFAVVGGTLLGFYLARPIRELVQVIERVKNGESDVRANAKSEDEIGLLAETLNEYLDEYSLLTKNPDRNDRDP